MTRAQRIGGAAVLGVLVASLVVNVLLVRTNVALYREVGAVRLDPAGDKLYAAEREHPTPHDKPVLVLFGDSRAVMWKSPALDDFSIVNRGEGNQTTAQILLRLDTDLQPLKPSVVVLQGGVNDLKTIADFPGQRTEIVSTCEANLRRIVERCRAIAGRVVLTTVFSIGDVPPWRRPLWSDDVDAAVREVNRFLPTLVGDGVVLFDAGPVLDDERGKIKPPYQYDFLHVAPAGYDALNVALVPFVRSVSSAR